jgi:2-octaprenyl-6-methoxyphenol hydroxylase
VPDHADLIIAGGGPVGAILALALKDSGLSVMVLEARSDFTRKPDPRALALSYGSMLMLRRLGIWQALPEPTPIETIHISQQGSFGRAVLQASDDGLPALGYVVDYAALDLALHQALADSGVHYVTGARVSRTRATGAYAVADFECNGTEQQATARLLALADGGRSLGQMQGVERCEHDYKQSAVVAQIKTEFPHRGIAFERFTPDGPVALLPSGADWALVWTLPPERAETVLSLSDDDFTAALHRHFGDRVGRILAAGKRASFPLVLKYSRPVTAQRTVLLGNAAQMLHPVAGQGFNLGLRDAWELSEEILAACKGHGKNAYTENEIRHASSPHPNPNPLPEVEGANAKGACFDLGDDAMLASYRARRRFDTRGSILFTDALVRGFSNADPLLRHARGIALAALDGLPPLKRLVMRKMIYGVRG